MPIYAIDPKAIAIYEIFRSKKAANLTKPIFVMIFDRIEGKIMPILEIGSAQSQRIAMMNNNALCVGCDDPSFKPSHCQAAGWGAHLDEKGRSIVPGQFTFMRLDEACLEETDQNRRIAYQDLIDEPHTEELRIKKIDSKPHWPELA